MLPVLFEVIYKHDENETIYMCLDYVMGFISKHRHSGISPINIWWSTMRLTIKQKLFLFLQSLMRSKDTMSLKGRKWKSNQWVPEYVFLSNTFDNISTKYVNVNKSAYLLENSDHVYSWTSWYYQCLSQMNFVVLLFCFWFMVGLV